MSSSDSRRRTALRLALAGAAVGLTTVAAVALFRHPITLLEWTARRTLGLAGLRQQLVEHHRGQWSYFARPGHRDPSPVTVVLVHGLGGQAGNWYKTVRSLRHVDVVVLDLPGHGDCEIEPFPWGTGTAFELYNQLLDEATDHRPLVLVGNSMGGWLSLLYSLDNPERVRRLVLVNSAGLEFDINRRLLMPANRQQAQRAIDAIYGKNAPRLPGFLLDSMIRRVENTPIAPALEHVDDAPFVDRRLAELTVPTDIIWGTDDGIIPVDHAFRFHQQIPNSRLHLMEGVGHSPQVTEPKPFNRLLRSIIAEDLLPPIESVAHR